MADQDTLPLMIELSEGERETGKRDVCLCHIDCATIIMIGHEAVGHEVVGHEAIAQQRREHGVYRTLQAQHGGLRLRRHIRPHVALGGGHRGQ